MGHESEVRPEVGHNIDMGHNILQSGGYIGQARETKILFN